MLKGYVKIEVVVHINTAPYLTADASSPEGRSVGYAEVVLDTIWACCGLRYEMSSCRFASFDLDKTFCTYGLITTSRAIDIGRIILRLRMMSRKGTNFATRGTHKKAYGTFYSALVY